MKSPSPDDGVVGDGKCRLRRITNASLAILSLCVVCTGCEKTPGSLPISHPSPISDGTVVLVRQSNEFGAFILMNQDAIRATNPLTGRPAGLIERMDYTWFLRTDGNGLMNPTNPAVTSGVVTGATRIAFGGFSIPWSIAARGSGWVYYVDMPFVSTGGTPFEMCPTTETNTVEVDAAAAKWRFRQSPPMDSKAWKDFFGGGIDHDLMRQ